MKIVEKYGTIRYYNENNQLHRTDGPDIECANGDKAWYINGEYLTEQEFNQLQYQPINNFDEGF